MRSTKHISWILSVLSILLYALSTSAQDLESLTKQSPVELGGNIRISSQFYNVSGIDPRRSPFAWQVSGSPSISIYGISVPLSFSFNGQSTSFNTPSFNRFGASPYYKWAKVHVGYRNMRFSQYTLSGKTFLGAGVELTPGNWRIAGMVGRLRNLAAVRNEQVHITNLVPDYRRKAYAIKLGYGSGRNYFDLMLFRSIDDQEDYFNAPSDASLQPLENLVIGSQFKFTVARRLTLDFNGAVSAFSDDIGSPTIGEETAVVQSVNTFFQPRQSSVFSYAGDVGLSLRLKRLSIGTKYQRIEPYFRSFGSNFFNNDKENLTLNTSLSLLGGDARINGSFGIERNDLQNVRAVKSIRNIGSVSMVITPSNQWNLNLRFSNYQRENRSGLLELNDTLRFVNIARNSGLNFTYRIDGESRKYTIGLNANLQTIEDQSALDMLSSDVLSYNGVLRFGIDFQALQLQVTPMINYNSYQLSDVTQERYGLGLRVSKKFQDGKTSANLSSAYNLNDYNGLRNGEVIVSRLSLSTRVFDLHRLGLNLSFIKRSSVLRKSFSEFRSRLTYGVSF